MTKNIYEDDLIPEGLNFNKARIKVIGVGGGKQEVVVTRSIYPRFTGALVVCEGAASASVRYAVTEAVGVLTGLASNQISVVKGKP